MAFKIFTNFNINFKKLFLLSLIIPTILAADVDENNKPPALKTFVLAIPVPSQSIDPAYLSDNPIIYMLSRQMFHRFCAWKSGATFNPASWQLPNLFPCFPWMNQTQKHRHP